MNEVRAVVIDHAQLIDGSGAPPIADCRVVIRGERIEAAGPRALVTMPEGAQVIDGTGSTVLPGLIDVHMHDASDANMALYIKNGVTSVRFGGGNQTAILALRERIQRDEIVGPRIFSVGAGVNATPHAWPGSHAADSPNEARRLVRRLISEEHVDAILATQGVDRASLVAITETAHEFAVPVIGQLWTVSARGAAAVGLDGLENTSRIPESDMFTRERIFATRGVSERLATLAHMWVEADRTLMSELAGILAEAGVALAPELVSFEAWARLSQEEVESDRDWPRDPEDPQVIAYQRQVAHISHAWTASDVAAQREAIPRFAEFCRSYADAGGRLLAGTDSGFGAILLQRELAWFRRAGLAPLQVIRTATRQAASALGRDDLGFLQAGRTADVIVVRGDPVADTAALRDVERVFIGGRLVYSRDAKRP